MNRLLELWDRLPRPAKFAVELLAAGLISYGLGWGASRLNRNKNRDTQAAELAAQSAMIVAQEEKRIADAMERAYPPNPDLTHPSLLHEHDDDKENCVDNNMHGNSCTISSTPLPGDVLLEVSRLYPAQNNSLPTLGGTAVDECPKRISSDGCNTTTCDCNGLCTETAVWCGKIHE